MLHDFHIVLIEDSETDAKIIRRALSEGQVEHRLTVLRDGRQALEYLVGLNEPGCAPELEPDLVLLDLNLPGMDGYQLLAQIKADPSLRIIPVVVLTTSHRDQDVVETYRAGANTYIQKPGEFAGYRDLVATLRSYWHQTAMRIPRDRARY
jgi:chemotaxis family two-component system response regulator Rcp1